MKFHLISAQKCWTLHTVNHYIRYILTVGADACLLWEPVRQVHVVARWSELLQTHQTHTVLCKRIMTSIIMNAVIECLALSDQYFWVMLSPVYTGQGDNSNECVHWRSTRRSFSCTWVVKCSDKNHRTYIGWRQQIGLCHPQNLSELVQLLWISYVRDILQ